MQLNSLLEQIGKGFALHQGRIVLIAFATILAIVGLRYLAAKLTSIVTAKYSEPEQKIRAQRKIAAAGMILGLLTLLIGLTQIVDQLLELQIATMLQGIRENWVIKKVFRIGVVCLLMGLGIRGAELASNKLFALFFRHPVDAEIKKRANTLSSFVRYLLLFAIIAVGSMMLLKEIGVEIGPILAGAGIVGIAVGFGAQNLVQDVISGFFILLEDQIRVGDVVAIKGKDGLVEKMSLRMIILRDFSGNVHYIRNGQIDIVTNMTKGFSNYVFDIRIGVDQDIDKVVEILKEVDEEMRQDPTFKSAILKPIEVYGIDQFTDSAVNIKARTTTLPMRQWEIGREFNRRLKKRFDEQSIRASASPR